MPSPVIDKILREQEISMKQLSIKEVFGGEVNFTNHISQNKDVSQRLLNCDMVTGSDYTVKSEHQTVDNKRVDLTIQNEEGEIITVIESQDATGWLIACIVLRYFITCEKKCMDGVLDRRRNRAREIIPSFHE